MGSRDGHDAALNATWLRRLLRPVNAMLSRLRPRPVLIVSSVVALLGLAAGLTFVFAASGSRPATASRLRPIASARPNPDTTEATPQFHVPARVVPLPLPSSGALPLPSSDQVEAAEWKSGEGGAALSAVTSQAGAVGQASAMKLYVEMKQACENLATSVSSAQSGPPIPVVAMEALYQKALSELATAAAVCQAGISEQADGDEYVLTTQNSADLSASIAALALGSKDLYEATGQISDLGEGE